MLLFNIVWYCPMEWCHDDLIRWARTRTSWAICVKGSIEMLDGRLIAIHVYWSDFPEAP